jgi:pyrimidine and pyridine-specific 5'-nucleotidase
VLEILQLKNPTKSEDRDVSEDRVEFEDQIEGIVYCDYTEPRFECKPDPGFYRKVMHSLSCCQNVNAYGHTSHQALTQANVTDPSKCLFVDDNRGNVDAAKKEGWGRCVHFHEPEVRVAGDGRLQETGTQRDEGGKDVAVISNLEELRILWPDIFKKDK